jgi:dTDP-4-amino-4,6-dideoxygalactose transaminase
MPCPVTPGGFHSYWLYAMTITGKDPESFVKALCAEGIPAGWGYTVKPIYLCTEALTKKRTFGASSWPFILNPVEYREGLCPTAERELLQLCCLTLHEHWTETEIRDIATAVRKVAKGMTT